MHSFLLNIKFQLSHPILHARCDIVRAGAILSRESRLAPAHTALAHPVAGAQLPIDHRATHAVAFAELPRYLNE